MNPNPNAHYWPWVMLIGRTSLFLLMQALFALALYAAGSRAAWDGAAAWWPLSVTITNGIMLLVLIALTRAEGGNYWEIFRIRRADVKGDLLALCGVLVIAAPLSYLPNVLLAGWLFGDAQQALALLLRPLPLWAAYASLLVFPITQGLTEIPTYCLFVMPRLVRDGLPRWAAVTAAALGLGFQHIAAPFLFDGRFIIWRGLMFLPFAMLTAIVLSWRPRLLPYLAIVHVLMDMSFATMLLGVAR